MCKKCPPPAVTCDYSEQSTKDTLAQLLKAETGKAVSSRWLDAIWQINYTKHVGKLGPTLRKEICVPNLSGEDLFAAYEEAIGATSHPFRAWIIDDYRLERPQPNFAWFDNHAIPRWLTIEACELQKVPSQRNRKLTRCLADWFLTTFSTHPEMSPDTASRLVDKIQTSIKAQNGRKLVLSANPLDKILASNFANYVNTSCHRWLNNRNHAEGETPSTCYPAGNMAYAFTADCLVLTSHTNEAKTIADVTLPKKVWRQFVNLTSNNEGYEDNETVVACLMRNYGEVPCELIHNIARKLVAEYLAGEDNPEWKRLRVRCNARGDYNYNGDSTDSVICLSRDYNESQGSYNYGMEIANPACPFCGRWRTDERCDVIGCEKCVPGKMKCVNCGDYCDEESSTTHNDDVWCQECFNNTFSYCDCCCEYEPSDEFTRVDDEPVCNNCAENIGHTCQQCGELFRDLSDIELCDDCQSDHDDEQEAEREEEEEAQRLADEKEDEQEETPAPTMLDDFTALRDAYDGSTGIAPSIVANPETVNQLTSWLDAMAPTGRIEGQLLYRRCAIECCRLSIRNLTLAPTAHDGLLIRQQLHREVYNVLETIFTPRECAQHPAHDLVTAIRFRTSAEQPIS